MRCLTLARALAARGWRCRFAVGPETPTAVPAVTRWDHFVLPEGADETAAIAARCAGRTDLLVVDHYARDAGFETACRLVADMVLAIDDLADRTHDCDLILDQSLGRRADDYRGLVPGSCRMLVGPNYALVAETFAARRGAALARRRRTTRLVRVLVSLGRMDGRGMIPAVLDAIAASGLAVQVDVAVSSAAPAIEEIRARAVRARAAIALHENAEDMAALMTRADLMIGTPGSTSWERCCLGLPAILIVLADNQRFIGRSLEDAGAAVVLDSREEKVSAAALSRALRALNGGGQLPRMAEAAAAVCDGEGASRTVDTVESLRQYAHEDVGT